MKSFLYFIVPAALLLSGCHAKNKPQEEATDSTLHSVEQTVQTVKNEYRTINDTLFHRSKDKIHDEYNGDYYYYSEQNAHVEWPVQLIGCTNVEPLQKALIEKAFPACYRQPTIEGTIQKFISTAKFLEYEEDQTAVPARQEDIQGGPNCYYASINVSPSMESPSLITYAILYSDYAGGAHGNYTLTHLNFDKKTSTVFDASHTFNLNQKQTLIHTINQYIDRREGSYEHTEEIPDFYATSEGITFVFEPYAIACYAEGIIEINIPYTILDSLLTAEFKEVLADAKNFKITKSTDL